MLDDRTKAQLRALLYPVQFEQRPEAGINRVLRLVVGRTPQTTPADYLRAIHCALDDRDEKLSEIIPQSHSEETVRAYLQRLSDELGVRAAPAVAGPFAAR
jgi:hypothetical protein